MATYDLVNIVSGNGWLPDSTKLLPESRLTYHHWSPVVSERGPQSLRLGGINQLYQITISNVTKCFPWNTRYFRDHVTNSFAWFEVSAEFNAKVCMYLPQSKGEHNYSIILVSYARYQTAVILMHSGCQVTVWVARRWSNCPRVACKLYQYDSYFVSRRN